MLAAQAAGILARNSLVARFLLHDATSTLFQKMRDGIVEINRIVFHQTVAALGNDDDWHIALMKRLLKM